MKNVTRKILSLALALCLVASMAVMASAASYSESGSYGSSIWGASGSCTTHQVTATTGLSNTTYLVYSRVEYYYTNSTKSSICSIHGGTYSSDPAERSSTASISTPRTVDYMNAWHFVNSSQVYTVSGMKP